MDLRKTLAPYAVEVGRLNNILPAFIMGVAWLESAGGTSGLATRANNLFSIKGSYNGDSITLPTREYYHNQWTTIDAQFKKYPSFRESCQDFCDLMIHGVSWNPTIYSRAVVGKTNLDQVCIDFGKTPYMTDPGYSAKLLSVIKTNNLEIFDTLPLAAPAPDESSKHYKSVVDYLKSKGEPSSFEARKTLAHKLNIGNYQGTAAQNELMLKLLGGR